MKRFSIFISGVQKELQAERLAVRDYLAGDALLRRYFDAFLFEDLQATDRRADELYLAEVDRADVYVAKGQDGDNGDMIRSGSRMGT